jgi:hypothetical protein
MRALLTGDAFAYDNGNATCAARGNRADRAYVLVAAIANSQGEILSAHLVRTPIIWERI